MKHDCGKTVCIIALLLTAFCSTTLLGCGDREVSLTTLVESPDEYKNGKVRVSGQVIGIEERDTTFLVLLESVNSSLICEFQDKPSLELKQVVIISGKVDILAGITFLRECEVKEG